MPKPIPVPDEVSKPFWDACNERRLIVQNCAACSSAAHLEWRAVSGRGRINGLGVWEHRGKVAVAGVGHSPVERRWDEQLEHSLGAYSILAAERAMADAGISPDEIDGVISGPGPLGDNWATRPFFDPPYDTEDGLTKVTAEWLARGLDL